MDIGEKNNSLVLVEELMHKIRPNGAKRRFGLFQCDCGDISKKAIGAVKYGYIKSCASCGKKRAEKSKLKHGLCKHPLYAKWNDMKNRCYNKKVDRYKNYGGRGIRVCAEWRKNFLSFYNWSIENGWSKGLTIERDNVHGDYSPENCSYIKLSEQKFNKTNTFFVTIKKEKISLMKFLEGIGKPEKYGTIWQGLKKGKTIEYYLEKYDLD